MFLQIIDAEVLSMKVNFFFPCPHPHIEVTSIRSGLRKRKRAESPQNTEPQVTEEWVEEEKLELWEIKQYGDRYVTSSLLILALEVWRSVHEPDV
jgi:nucleosome-remodeling factor subunit BPTF